MNFLLGLFNKSTKGDSYRPNATPVKYVDSISQLNSKTANRATSVSTSVINRIQKTIPTPTQGSSKGSILSGS